MSASKLAYWEMSPSWRCYCHNLLGGVTVIKLKASSIQRDGFAIDDLEMRLGDRACSTAYASEMEALLKTDPYTYLSS